MASSPLRRPGWEGAFTPRPSQEPGERISRVGLLQAPASDTMPLMRWSEHKSEQFQALRRAEAQGRLTEEDRLALDGLLADLDDDEAEALRPADEQLDVRARAMDAERAELEIKAGELERIAREEAGLLAEARAYVAQLRQRSAALAEDFRRVTGRSIAPAR